MGWCRLRPRGSTSLSNPAGPAPEGPPPYQTLGATNPFLTLSLGANAGNPTAYPVYWATQQTTTPALATRHIRRHSLTERNEAKQPLVPCGGRAGKYHTDKTSCHRHEEPLLKYSCSPRMRKDLPPRPTTINPEGLIPVNLV